MYPCFLFLFFLLNSHYSYHSLSYLLQSAAGVVGKVHSGDEVLCVNLQTVVGVFCN